MWNSVSTASSVGIIISRLTKEGSKVAYFLDMFTLDTWISFRESGATMTGFPERHRRLADEQVRKGDIFLCYMTRLSRWCGILQVEEKVPDDYDPIPDFLSPYPVRFKVKPIALLDPETAVPTQDDEVWKTLTITNQFERGYPYWSGFFRSSLNNIDDNDGHYLMALLKGQLEVQKSYPLTDRDKRQLSRKGTVRALDRDVEVEVPDDDDTAFEPVSVDLSQSSDARDKSIHMQAKVARVGIEMGFRVWVPRNDRGRVLERIPEELHDKFLDALPLNYDDTTLRTVEQIDVLWLRGRAMARAFEIEHTTAIYSGLLRMADLLALQPNMDIRLHIVAPSERKPRVLREIRRPVFSLIEGRPLYEQCSFLSYESVNSISEEKFLSHMRDTLIEAYEEREEV